MGFGLCNIELTEPELPVDTLSMILLGERLGTDKTLLIADSHAAACGFDASEVDRVARTRRDKIESLLCNLDLHNWNVVLGSDIQKAEDYKDILSTVVADNPYVQQETADIKWARQQGAKIKVGWSMKGGTRDEVFFDRVFKETFPGTDIGFVYTPAGKTFNPCRVRAPPYLVHDKDARLLIGENVHDKLATAKERFGGVNTCMKTLKHITRLYDTVVGGLDRGSAEDRLQQMMDRCGK